MKKIITLDNLLFKIVSYPVKSTHNIDTVLTYDIKKYFPINSDELDFISKIIHKEKDICYVLIIAYNQQYKNCKNKLFSLIWNIIQDNQLHSDKQYLISIPYNEQNICLALHKNFTLAYFSIYQLDDFKKQANDTKEYLNNFFNFSPEIIELTKFPTKKNILSQLTLLPFKKYQYNIYNIIIYILACNLIFLLVLSNIIYKKNDGLNNKLENRTNYLSEIQKELKISKESEPAIKHINNAFQTSRMRNTILKYFEQNRSKKLKINKIDYNKDTLIISLLAVEEVFIFTFKDKISTDIKEYIITFNDINKTEDSQYSVNMMVR